LRIQGHRFEDDTIFPGEHFWDYYSLFWGLGFDWRFEISQISRFVPCTLAISLGTMEQIISDKLFLETIRNNSISGLGVEL